MSRHPDLESATADMIFLRDECKIPLNTLAEALQASPREIRETIRRLKSLGYPVRSSGTGQVERLPFRPIDAQELRAELMTERIGKRTEWRLHVRSTQDELKRLAREVEDGTVLLAETQYAGRGRLTRNWISPAGGIWMSVWLRPTWAKSHQILTLTFAVAVARAISSVAEIFPQLKWPNDLMVGSRKVAGILAEATYHGNNLDHLIIGLGVNANINLASFPRTLRKVSTSLSHELGREINRNLLTRRIIEEMDSSYSRFESGHASGLLDEARRFCSTLGRNVQVTTSEGRFKGKALDLGDDGQLLVRLDGGATVSFYAGDVVHLR